MLVTYSFVVNGKLLNTRLRLRVQSINFIKTKKQLVMGVKLIDVVYTVYIHVVPDPFNK